jgi:dimethylhistidine N-methyltransferase
MANDDRNTILVDFEPSTQVFLSDILQGMRKRPRSLPCKYFYDEIGSRLFDEICELEEYYLTRTELEVMQRFAGEMTEQIGPGVRLVEYGSGSSIKTRILLDHLERPVAYVPVDISREHLQRTADELSVAYPDIEILPVCADFMERFDLPEPDRTPTHSAVYFPGSTIGNFQPADALRMLARIAPLCGTGGGLLIGIDLHKDVEIIEAAYNDKHGVTAEFNLNLLHRINRELEADFDTDNFSHRAVYNTDLKRVEIDLVSDVAQTVCIDTELFEFKAGEAICTEYSHKYTIDGFADMAGDVGLTLRRHWMDDDALFGVLHFALMR